MMYRYKLSEILVHVPPTKYQYIELLRKIRLITLREEDYQYPPLITEEERIRFACIDQLKLNEFLDGKYFKRKYYHISDNTNFIKELATSKSLARYSSLECEHQRKQVYVRIDSSWWRNAHTMRNRLEEYVDPIVITTEPLSFIKSGMDVELLI